MTYKEYIITDKNRIENFFEFLTYGSKHFLLDNRWMLKYDNTAINYLHVLKKQKEICCDDDLTIAIIMNELTDEQKLLLKTL